MFYFKKPSNPCLLIALALSLSASTQAGQTFEAAIDSGHWTVASTWSPQGVPGASDSVRIRQNTALFIGADVTIRDFLVDFDDPQLVQVVPVGGARTLQINGTLRNRKGSQAGWVTAFRGNASNNGQRLTVNARRVETLDRGGLAFGVHHEEQTDRPLAGLTVEEEVLIDGGSVLRVFTDGAVARFGSLRFGEGGGRLFMSFGPDNERDFAIGGLNGGGNNAVIAATSTDHRDSVVNLRLTGSGDYSFGGRIRSREDGSIFGCIVNLYKEGSGTQRLTGESNFHGNTTVSGGRLIVDGSFQREGRVTVTRGGSFGGGGAIGGDLEIRSGGRLIAVAGRTLTVRGQLMLAEDFSVRSLDSGNVNLDAGRHILIDATVTPFEELEIQNKGRSQAAQIAGGRRAWFEGPGLILVVE